MKNRVWLCMIIFLAVFLPKTKGGFTKPYSSTFHLDWNAAKDSLPGRGNPLVWKNGSLMTTQVQGYAFDSLNWRFWQKQGAADFEDSLGWASVLHALGRAKGMKVVSQAQGGIDLRNHELTNLLLYRALADKPAAYLLTPSGEDEMRLYQKFDAKDFLRLLQRFERGPFGSPIANLVYFDPNDQPNLQQAGWILPPLVLALTAAGFDVRVTLNGDVLPQAKLYYFVTPGGKVLPPASWLKILENQGQMVFLQTWKGMSLQEPWRLIRKNVGISFGRVLRSRNRLPETSTYEGQVFATRGFAPLPHESSDLGQQDLEGRLYLGSNPVLVAGRGNHYIVNAKFLHLEFGFFLNALFKPSGRLLHPLPGLLSWGPPTAVFALRELETQIHLPGTGRKVRVFRRHPENGLVLEAVMAYEGRLKFSMKRHEILIAERF